MFGDFRIADQIAYCCARIDVLCRVDLQNNIIANERDYVSALSTRIRDNVSPLFSCFAQTIPYSLEMEYGTDGIIIFKYNSEVKVGWYEAKWPRIKQPNYRWDSLSSRSKSHFSEQLIKQEKLPQQFAVWEMFFNEDINGNQCPPFDAVGSSCTWHKNTFDFMLAEGLLPRIWTTRDLERLLDLHGTSFYNIIYQIISCQKGSKIMLDSKARYISIEAEVVNYVDESPLVIPLPNENSNRENDRTISSFMQENKIAGYLYIDLDIEESLL